MMIFENQYVTVDKQIFLFIYWRDDEPVKRYAE